MAQEYESLQFTIEKILPHGIFVFAGSPKAGKSWLTIDMCQAISTGGKLWDVCELKPCVHGIFTNRMAETS